MFLNLVLTKYIKYGIILNAMRVSLCYAQVKNASRSLGNAIPRSFHSRVSLCYAQVKNASRSLGNAIPRSFHSRVWRNWQLGERARPVGDKASLTRRRSKENFERERERRLCFKRSRGRGCRTNNLICGYGGIGRRARFRF